MRLPLSVSVLLLGSGGRECAFAWKIAQSKVLGQLFIAPGNAQTSQFGVNVDIDPNDFATVGQFVVNNHINLVVVGSEEPLVRGIVDFFSETDQIKHIPIVGPSKVAAMLEGSKEFAKVFMQKQGIPTAKYLSVNANNIDAGCEFLDSLNAPYVLKADGLAAGKGVLIIDDIKEAKKELKSMILEAKFGAASKVVVVEEFLSGVELSVFVVTDGQSYKILPSAKDYKRIGEGDKGLNTGGMGAVSPVHFADEQFMQKVEERVIIPTIEGIKSQELNYKGFIFLGLINVGGDPYVIEYNVRMGDPETEAVLPLIESDIVDLFDGIVHRTLNEKVLVVKKKVSTTIVCTAKGYPQEYNKGDVIEGLENVCEDVVVFHSGTKKVKNDVVTNGGRVLAVTAIGDTIQKALNKAYKQIDKISFDGMYYRKDIGKDLIKLGRKKKEKKISN